MNDVVCFVWMMRCMCALCCKAEVIPTGPCWDINGQLCRVCLSKNRETDSSPPQLHFHCAGPVHGDFDHARSHFPKWVLCACATDTGGLSHIPVPTQHQGSPFFMEIHSDPRERQNSLMCRSIPRGRRTISASVWGTPVVHRARGTRAQVSARPPNHAEVLRGFVEKVS